MCVLLALPDAAAPTSPWTALDAGLELGAFPVAGSDGSRGTVYVLRADPRHVAIRLFSAAFEAEGTALSVREWVQRKGLLAAANAGMFHPDRLTHVGYLRDGERVNSPVGNRYRSAAAFHPVDTADPLFRIFDLDEVPLEEVRRRYRSVVQNLRLVKRPGLNQWSKQPRRWSEAALGEDREGRLLLIFCREPFSMHALVDILLGLPIDLVAAQHLEGGPEAQFSVRAGAVERHLVGGFEPNLFKEDDNGAGWPVPNVIGIARP